MNENIIGSYTGLSGIQEFCPDQPPGRHTEVGVFLNDHGTFAAKLQRDRGQMPCCCLEYDFSYGGTSSEKYFVELIIQQRGCLYNSPFSTSQEYRSEMFVDYTSQCCTCIYSEFAGF